MAFDKTNFTVYGASKAGSAASLYGYSTTDTIADANTEGYFNDLSNTLKVNDIIFITSSTGGTPVSTICKVLSNASGVVDISDGLTIPATDTD